MNKGLLTLLFLVVFVLGTLTGYFLKEASLKMNTKTEAEEIDEALYKLGIATIDSDTNEMTIQSGFLMSKNIEVKGIAMVPLGTDAERYFASKLEGIDLKGKTICGVVEYNRDGKEGAFAACK